jgi:hypothetical protein
MKITTSQEMNTRKWIYQENEYNDQEQDQDNENNDQENEYQEMSLSRRREQR